MSATVDNRVVEMRFDNKNFESNVAQSMSTLEKLKQSLNLTGATKGLEKVDAAAKNINFSDMSSGIETVRAKFSALEVMGVTALANITNSAINAGKRIVSALTIDPIKTGFQEYETQINAVQTILANTSHNGTSLDQVNAALDELNTYADKTIYNFTEMTRNIGTFTAAGVELDTSVAAIKGIANLAAISGSTSQQASTAMYQLSQAIAAGRVSLQDWNSVVNAGMGGKVFQDALMNTAEAMGIAVDRSISFRESISTTGGKSSWLTSDVLLNTLKQFTGDMTDAELAAIGFTKAQIASIQEMGGTATEAATKVKTLTQLYDTTVEAVQSGWAQSWRLILGDFEQARETFSKAADYIGAFVGKVSDARNEMLKGAMSSPWEQLTEKIEASGVATEDFKKALKETAKEHGINVDSMIDDQTTFEDTLKNGWLTSDIVLETLKKMSGGMDGVSDSTEGMTDKLEYFQKVVNEVLHGDYKNGVERVEALTKAGYNYAEVQALVNKTVDGHKLTLEDLTDAQLKSVGYTDEQIKKIRALAEEAEKAGTPLNELIGMLEKKSGRELLFEGIGNIGQSLITLFESIGKAYENIFPSEEKSQKLYNTIAAFESFTESLVISDDTAKNITKTFEGLFAAIDIIATVTGGALKFGFEVFREVLSLLNIDIWEFTCNVGEAVVSLRDWIDEHNFIKDAAKGAADIIVNMGDKIKSAAGVVDEWIDKFMEIPEVQNAITKFRDVTGTAIGNVKEFFRGGVDIVGNFIEKLRGMDSFSWEGLKEAFRSLREDLKEHFSGIDIDLSGVKGFFESFKNKVVEIFKKLKTDAAGTISEFREDVDNGLGKVGEIFDKVKTKAQEFINFLKEKFGEVGIGDIMAVGLSAGILTLATKIDNFVEAISNPLEMLDGLVDAFAKKAKAEAFNATAEGMIKLAVAIGILVAAVVVLAQQDWEDLKNAGIILGAVAGGIVVLAGALKLLKVDAKSLTSIVGLAGGILILVVALEKLVEINGSGDDIISALGVAAGIAAALLIVLAAMKKIKPGDVKSAVVIAITLVGFAGAIRMLVESLEAISNLTITASDVATLAGIIVALGLVAKSLTGITGTGGIGKAAFLLAMPAAIKSVIGALEDIAEFDANGVKKNIEAFVVVMGTFAGLMLATNLAGEHAAKAGVAILAVTASIRLLIPAIEELGSMDQGVAERGIVMVGVLELLMGALIALSKLAGQHAAKAGLMLIEMSAALLILTAVLAIVAEIARHNPEGLDRAMQCVSALTILMGGLIAISAYASEIKGVKGTLITLTVCVSLLAAAIAGLSLLDESSITAASEALSLVMACFAAIVATTPLAKKATGTLIIMTAVVAALAGILYGLASLEVEASIGTAAALSLLMTSLSASVLIISKSGSNANDALLAIGAMTLVLAAVAVILKYMSDMDVEPSIETAGALSLLMAALASSTVIMGMANPTSSGALVALAGVVVALGIVAEILAKLDQMDVEPSIETALALSILMGALSAVCVVLSGIGQANGIIAAAAKGAAAFDIVVVAIGALMVGLGALMEYVPGCEEFLNKGLEVLGKIGTAIGEFVGGLLGGALAGLMSGLPKVGEHLAGFAEAISGIDSGAADGAAALAKAMVALTAASFINGVSSLLSALPGWPSTEDFAEKFAALGKGVSDFAKAVGDVDGEAVKASAEAGTMLAKLANSLPAYGGKLQEWLGEKIDMKTFGAHIMIFGEYLAKYSKTITAEGAFDGEAVKASAEAATMLSELANSLPKYGGKLQEWFGETMDLETFGAHIMVFAECLAEYSKTVSAEGAINAEAIESSAKAATLLSDLANGLPSYGGKISEWFLGNKMDMATFGEQILVFGEALVGYSAVVSAEGAINQEAVTASSTAAEILVNLADSLPDYNGTVAEWFLGNKIDLKTFGEQLVYFGEGLADYSNAVSGVDSTIVTSTASAATVLSTLANSLPTKTIFDGKATLEDFGKQLSKFGDKFYEFYENISDVDLEHTGLAADIIKRLADVTIDVADIDPNSLEKFAEALKELSKTGINSFVTAFSGIDHEFLESAVATVKKLMDLAGEMADIDTSGMSKFAKALQELAKSGIDKFVNECKNGGTRVKTAVESMLSKAVDVVKAKETDILNSFKTFVTNAVSAINSRQQEFLIAGNAIASWLVNGINFKTTDVLTSFQNVIINSLNSINGRQQDFIISGKTIMAGLITGIDSKKLEVIKIIVYDIVYKAWLYIVQQMTNYYREAAITLLEYFIIGLTEKSVEVVFTIRSIILDTVNAIKEKESEFMSAGVMLATKVAEGLNSMASQAQSAGYNIAMGVAAGISSGQSSVISAAIDLAQSAINAVTSTLDIHSPSREMYVLGGNAAIGFVQALIDYCEDAEAAGEEIADGLLDSLKEALSQMESLVDDEIETDPVITPVITPVIDMSNVDAEAKKIDAEFSRHQAVSISYKRAASSSSTQIESKHGSANGSGATLSFVQNNYSPKALSRTEIYRQTKNQFAAMERKVKA